MAISTQETRFLLTAKDRTKVALKSVKRNFQGVGRAVTGVHTKILAVVGIGGLALLTRQALDAADQIGKLSTRLGVSTEALSEYKHVAELSGIEFNALAKSWQFMQNQISDAVQGIGDGQKALEELGLSAERLNLMSADAQFEAIADKMQLVKGASDRTRLAMDLFGGRGVALLQTMTDGAGGLQAMRKEAQLLGISLSDDQARGAERANDAMTKLKATTSALSITMASELAGPLEGISNHLTQSMIAAGGFQTEIRNATRGAIEGFADLLGGIDAAYNYIAGNEFLQTGGIIGFLLFGKAGLAGAIAIDQMTNKIGKNVGQAWQEWNPSEVNPGAGGFGGDFNPDPLPGYQLGDLNRSNGSADYLAHLKSMEEKYGTGTKETVSVLGRIEEVLRQQLMKDNTAVAG